MRFLHDGVPMPTRRALIRYTGFQPVPAARHGRDARVTVKDQLLNLLAHPNIASKHWIIRQYDHEVQGGSVIKPLTGPLQQGPSDAAVLRPKLDSIKGIALACGLAPQFDDPYQMTIAAIDEAIRNVVAVGADPSRVAILDNFCWPSVDDENTMGTLVRACEACRDAALAYGVPFISGKDSLHNQFTNQETGGIIRIPRTLLISAIGVIDDVRKCVTMDLKKPGNSVHVIGARPHASLAELAAVHRVVAELIGSGLILSCHDCSDGGVAVAAAEMCIASGLGVECDLSPKSFDELLATYLVEVADSAGLKSAVGGTTIVSALGTVTAAPRLKLREGVEIGIAEMTRAWRGTLDW
jgi:phosphoribosylformylglycinamidine synthase